MERRKFLKSAVIGGVGASLTATVTAKEEDDSGREAPEKYIREVQRRKAESYNGVNVGQSDGGVSPQDVPADPREPVYLGTNKQLTTTNRGDHGTTASFSATALFAQDDTGNDEVEAGAITAGGAGTATAWAWVGHPILVHGSGEQLATITLDAYLDGSFSVVNDGSNFAEIKLKVVDRTDNEMYDESVFLKSDYIKEVQESLTDSLVVPLQADHTYLIAMEATAEVTVDVDIEEASSDMARGDGDTDYVSFETARIIF